MQPPPLPPPPPPAAATTLWAQCDLCSRWRALPALTVVDGAAPWICAMHPLKEAASCSAPAEAGAAADDGGDTIPASSPASTAVFVSSCDGWTSRPTPSTPSSSSCGEPRNENYWRSLLAESPRLGDWPSAAWWLATSFEAASSASPSICSPPSP